MNKFVLWAAVIAVLSVYGFYFLRFWHDLDYVLSAETAIWAQLGDYAGGVLGPLLSFFTILLLIRSLDLQYAANKTLRNELENKEHTEKLRSFEALFFNMIESQQHLFRSFRLSAAPGITDAALIGAQAVHAIEDALERLDETGGTSEQKTALLDELDSTDQIFGLCRSFYIIVKMIDEKLSNIEGFSDKDRKSHIQIMVHFSDFAHLRLILICLKYADYQSLRYLNRNEEFISVLTELELFPNPY